MKIKKILLIFLILLAVISTNASLNILSSQITSGSNTQPASVNLTKPAPEAYSNIKLLFLGNKNIAPIVYLDGDTPSGVVVDIIKAIAKHIPQPIEIKAMDWPEAQKLVLRGEADALIQINQTEERKKIYDFSDALLESQFSIFTGTNRMGISGLSSLRGLRVGVEAGGLPRQVLEKNPQILLTIIPNFLEGFKMLNASSIDAVVVDYRVGAFIIADNNIRNIKITGKPIAFSYSSIAVKKGNTKLLNAINNALRIIKSDGTYQQIINKWKPKEVVFQTREQITQKIFFVTIIILIIFFLIAAIWTVTLKRELTKRKVVEAALKEQYTTLQSITNSANALIFSVDKNYCYTSFNTSHAKVMNAIYGIEIETGHNILNYMKVTEDRDIAKRNIDRALAGEQLVDEAYSGEKIRSRKYFQVSHTPIKNEGEIIGVVVFAQDITSRKQSEDELRNAYEYTQQLIASANVMIIGLDSAGCIRIFNKAAEEITGYTIEELSGINWFEKIVPKDRYPEVWITFQNYQDKTGAMPITFENPILTKSGEERIISWQNSTFSNLNAKISTISFGMDITKRKQAEEALIKSEEKYRAIFEESFDALLITSPAGKILDMNQKGIQIFGYDTKEEIMKLDLKRDLYLYPHDRKRFLTMTDEQGTAEIEIVFKKKNGEHFIAHCSLTAVKDKHGAITTYRGILRDITDQKRAEAALCKSMAELREAQRVGKIGNFDWDAITDTIIWSEEYYNIYGFDPKQTPPGYEEHKKTYSNESAAKLDAAVKKSMETGEPYEVDLEQVWPDGSIRKWITARGEVKKNDNGQIVGLRGTAQDITERKLAETERFEQLHFFESMNKINKAIQKNNSLEQMMSDVFDEMLSILDCDRVWLVYPCDPNASSWNVPMERTKPEYPGVYELKLHMPMDHSVAESFRSVLASDGPMKYGEGTGNPLPEDVSKKFGFKSYISIVLHPKIGKPWQLGMHQCSYSRIWTKFEERLLQEIARRLEDSLTSLLSYRNLLESENRYYTVFENSPVSLWEEDFSKVKVFFDDLKKEKIDDIEIYLTQHPKIIRQCADMVKIVDVNKAALQLYDAANKEELLTGANTFTQESFSIFKWELIYLWNGRTEMKKDTIVKTFNGNLKNVTVCFLVCPGYEKTLSKALVSLVDITERKQAEESLKKLNETLEERVNEEVQKNIKQCQILIHQSRLAAMGEMIRNIAHQWRQPLNALSVILANIKDASDFGELNKKILEDSLKKADQFIQGMSVTIDDFRNYFNPNKEKQKFDIMEAINVAVKIMSPSFSRHKITLDYEINNETYHVTGFPNEFSQVLVVVLTNAKDAIIKHKVTGEIKIKVTSETDNIIASITDNGGGISSEIFDRIFEPYFTTKEIGTGIGLYMSREIMKNMNGFIKISNTKDGVCVNLGVPK
ncbi:PAS domain S-box protein [Candidatus Dependentiae bacterium]|nr:PAS domain S-box protein [Candidatus Dependentiae bacterium]